MNFSDDNHEQECDIEINFASESFSTENYVNDE